MIEIQQSLKAILDKFFVYVQRLYPLLNKFAMENYTLGSDLTEMRVYVLNMKKRLMELMPFIVMVIPVQV
jgi:hypothetical protein